MSKMDIRGETMSAAVVELRFGMLLTAKPGFLVLAIHLIPPVDLEMLLSLCCSRMYVHLKSHM